MYNKVVNKIAPLISPFQFGFQINICTSSLQQLLFYVRQLKVEFYTIHINFRKTFDNVSLNELLTKLWGMGITGTLRK